MTIDAVHRPHHDGSPAYVATPAGAPVVAPELGQRVRVWVDVPHAARLTQVHLRYVHDGEPHYAPAERVRRGRAVDRYEVEVPVVVPTQRYRFELEGPGGTGWLTQRGWLEHDVPDTWDFALVAGPPPPTWVPDAVLYQIFPDRFARAGVSDAWPAWAQRARWDDPVATSHPAVMRQLYGGDLPGIVARLDHLLDLGVTGIYLNPIFPAAENHRYCATSFDEVDPLLGGDAALIDLAQALHGNGLRLLGDLTLNHSGSEHPWFRAAQADATSAEAGFYLFHDHPDGYHAWAGVPSLPRFDHRDPELRRRLYVGAGSVAERYLRPPFALDGWRIDAANMAGRCGGVDVAHEVQRRLRATVAAVGDDRYLLAEHCHDATADLQGDGWHGTMDYAGFTRPVWSWLADPNRHVRLLGPPAPVARRDAATVAATIDLFRGQLPWRSVLHSLTLLCSHDTARWATVAGDQERRHVGLVWLLTFPGVPSLYYGDEIGLGGDTDDAGRAPMPWHDRDRWDPDTLELVRRLIGLRRRSVALRHGGLRWLYANGDTLVFLREHPEERVLVRLSRAASEAVELDASPLEIGDVVGVFGPPAITRSSGRLTLPATAGPAAHVYRLSRP